MVAGSHLEDWEELVVVDHLQEELVRCRGLMPGEVAVRLSNLFATLEGLSVHEMKLQPLSDVPPPPEETLPPPPPVPPAETDPLASIRETPAAQPPGDLTPPEGPAPTDLENPAPPPEDPAPADDSTDAKSRRKKG